MYSMILSGSELGTRYIQSLKTKQRKSRDF